MKIAIPSGTTSKLIRFFVRDTSQLSLIGLANVAYNSSGLKGYYSRVGDSGSTAISFSTASVGTWTSGGLVAVDNTNMPGVLEFGVPNACLSGGDCHIVISGVTNMEVIPIEIVTANLPANTQQIAGQAATLDGNNYLKVSMYAILGTVLTETAGQIAAGFKKWFNVATPTSDMNTITNLTNAPTAGDFTAAMKSSVTAAVPSAATIQTGLATSAAQTTTQTSLNSITAKLPANNIADETILTAQLTIINSNVTAIPTNPYTGTPPTVQQIRSEMDANSTKLANLTGPVATHTDATTIEVAIAAVGTVPAHFTNSTFSADGVFATASLVNSPNSGGTIVVSNTVPAAAAIASQVPSQIGITTFNTLRVTLPQMGSLTGRTSLIFTLKKAVTDPDSAALIQISESGGLLIANGATASNASYGSLSVTDASAGTVNLYIHQSITALLTPTNGVADARVWDCIYKTSTDHNPPISGKCIVTAGVTQT